MDFINKILVLGMASFFIELYLANFCFMFNVKKRKFFYLRFVVFLGLGCLFYFLPGQIMVGSFNFSYSIVYVGMILSSFFLYKTNWKTIVFNSVSAYALQHIAWNILFLIVENLMDPSTVNQAGCISLYVSIFLIVYGITLFVIIYRKKVFYFDKIGILNIVASCIIIFITIFLSLFAKWDYVTRIYTIIGVLVGLLIQVGFIDVGDQKRKQQQLQMEKENLQNLLRQQAHQQEIAKETINIINIKCHDMKNQIEAIKKLNNKEADEYIKDIERNIDIYGDIAKTGNEILDVVLTEKGLLCNNKDIRFTYIVDGVALKFLSSMDLSSLFGNLLDNAIEAVQKVDQEYRFIKLNVNKRGGLTFIKIENYCSNKIQFINGRPITNKKDHNYHGLGIKSMEYIIKKYDGVINFDLNDNIFSVDIMFPNSDQNND